eukprot:453999-Prymnesium_polylepis.1
MEGDEFDTDDEFMRRTEFIETQTHGALHARMVGDGEDPLILYLHSSKERASSFDFNPFIIGLADAMRNGKLARLEAARGEAFNCRVLSSVRIEGHLLSSLLQPEQLEKVAKAFVSVNFEQYQVVIEEGAKGEAFFLIKTGSALVTMVEKGEVALAPLPPLCSTHPPRPFKHKLPSSP